jgi:galactokinase
MSDTQPISPAPCAVQGVDVDAAETLATGDAARMGELMNASHASLRDDFEVSSEALDVMVECARATAGCHGARMTVAGFGGCAVALAKVLARTAGDAYRQATGNQPQVYVCTANDGAGIA